MAGGDEVLRFDGLIDDHGQRCGVGRTHAIRDEVLVLAACIGLWQENTIARGWEGRPLAARGRARCKCRGQVVRGCICAKTQGRIASSADGHRHRQEGVSRVAAAAGSVCDNLNCTCAGAEGNGLIVPSGGAQHSLVFGVGGRYCGVGRGGEREQGTALATYTDGAGRLRAEVFKRCIGDGR